MERKLQLCPECNRNLVFVAKEVYRNLPMAVTTIRMKPDVENLVLQSLIEFKSIPHDSGSHQVLRLTKNDHRFLTHTQSAGKGHALYHGFFKPCEAHHDADRYRLYQKAASKIDSHGGRNLRVILDYEVKKHLYRDLAMLGQDRNSDDGKHTVAERHGPQVVRGKIPVRDVRIESETRDGEPARVDLELPAGHNWRSKSHRKGPRGFSLYAHADNVAKLRRILDQRELAAGILSL